MSDKFLDFKSNIKFLSDDERNKLENNLKEKLNKIFNKDTYKFGDYTKLSDILKEITTDISKVSENMIEEISSLTNEATNPMDDVKEILDGIKQRKTLLFDEVKHFENKNVILKVKSFFSSKDKIQKIKKEFLSKKISSLSLIVEKSKETVKLKIEDVKKTKVNLEKMIATISTTVEKLAIGNKVLTEIHDKTLIDEDDVDELFKGELELIRSAICGQIETIMATALEFKQFLLSIVIMNDNHFKVIQELEKIISVTIPSFTSGMALSLINEKQRQAMDTVNTSLELSKSVIENNISTMKSVSDDVLERSKKVENHISFLINMSNEVVKLVNQTKSVNKTNVAQMKNNITLVTNSLDSLNDLQSLSYNGDK